MAAMLPIAANRYCYRAKAERAKLAANPERMGGVEVCRSRLYERVTGVEPVF